MAADESDTNGGNIVVASSDSVENINEIHNYLQSFNKEIGETTVGATSTPTYYTIDTSQVLAADNAGSPNSNVVAASTADGDTLPTFALYPDAVGGYVLIVQQSATGAQNDVSSASLVAGTGATLTLARSSSSDLKGDVLEETVPLTRIKQERVEIDKPNDISVYDFEEANPPIAGNIEEEEPEEELCANEAEEMIPIETSGGDIKPLLVTPKQKRPKKSTGTSIKKHKLMTPTTPVNPNQHMCNYCNYTSNKRYLLSRHMKSHSEERPHKCGICERGFKTIASLQNHVNTHTGVRPHGCKYCDAAFTTSGELVRHVRYRHTHEKPHRCTECDYASVELSKLKRHMRCHTGERPYQCPHCTYASPDTYKLKRHLRIHTGEKPYQCDVCHARFTQSNSLKAHKLIHSGNKPVFKCDQCPTTCGRKTDLRIHVQKLHTSDKPLTCKRCDQSFADRYSFKLHLKSHEGEKCFKCDLCNYASVSARHLESHMLIHTDQKPYECDECDQSFRQKQLLKRHKNLYHNPEYIPPQPKEKTHECPHCTKAFRHKGNLMRHLVVHDPDAYKDAANYDGSMRMNDSHQLIDDESDENSQMILPNTDEESLDPQTLQFTLDPQTQQMISGEQVVVFEVVQINDEDTNSQTSYALDQSASAIILDQTSGSKKRTAILAPGGSKLKTVRNASLISANGNSKQENIIIQLQAEDEEAANTIQAENIIDDPDYMAPKSAKIASNITVTTPNQVSIAVPPPLVIPDDTRMMRDQIQKQKDLAECFGFKDDDDEDMAILSMPAAHAQ